MYATAKKVLMEVNRLLKFNTSYNVSEVYEELSIFDWWTDKLTVNRLKQMRAFLNMAIKNGFEGYVCFNVGVKYCSNGMWAYKNTSTDGHSPSGDFIYRTFNGEKAHYYSCISGEMSEKLTKEELLSNIA